MTEPKTARMNFPEWDGDPSDLRDYQQEARLYKTADNLEVNWSGAARLVGGVKGAARRVGQAMTDQELLNERLTETVEAPNPRWPCWRQSLGSNDHRKA